jgi:formamidopyrimidine-DNA glycosylase
VPELPEVESYRRFFADHATGKPVRRVEVLDQAIVRNAPAESVNAALRGRRFEEPRRHGKWLICPAGGPSLLFHFGMTGDLVWSDDEPSRHRHDRLVIVFGDGELRYRNMRRLGGVWLAHGEEELRALLVNLGPDALEVDRSAFLERLSRRRGGVKAALMDQRLVAGVGNLVADEILWQARIHPRSRVEDLDPKERALVFRALRRVLGEAVERPDYLEGRTRWLSQVRGRPGARCPRCGTPLARTVAAGRTTHFCPRCQTQPPGGRGD